MIGVKALKILYQLQNLQLLMRSSENKFLKLPETFQTSSDLVILGFS